MSVSEVTEPRLLVPSLARGLGLLAYALSRGQSGTHSAVCSLGPCHPRMGGMFDREVHVFSKQTLIHVPRRNLQTDFCRPHPSEERWAL